MRYYIAENGQAVGPFEPNELMARGLTVNSLVWGEGMPSWTSASQVPELAALLTGQSVGTGSVDVQLPQVPPVGQTQLPETPPMGEQMQLPPLPQVPPVTNPQPTTPTTPTTPTMPTTPVGQAETTPLPTNPLPFPQGGPTTTTTTTPQTSQAAPKTWLVESIIATLACSFCCGVPFIGLIPGFVAIYNAFMAKTKFNAGDIDGANKKAASAKKWFYITIAVGLACAVYGAFVTLQNSNITDVIKDVQNGDMPFFYGLPK